MGISNCRKSVMLFGVTSAKSLKLMRGYPQSLVAEGWEVHLVSSNGPLLRELAKDTRLGAHAIRMVRKPSPIRDVISLFAWIRLVATLKPDVVSSGTPKAGLLGMIASRLCKVPKRVYHLRGLRIEGETGLKYQLLRFFEKVACTCATEVLAVSRSLRTAAISAGIVRPEKIHVLGAGSSNGVDLEHFSPDKRESASESLLLPDIGLVPGLPVVGFVGRLASDKGVTSLMSALRLLSERGVPHQLLIVGDTDEHSRASNLNKDVSDFLSLSIQTGHVPDVAPYYQLMDILVLPTRREGLPNVAIEAQASGVPVITTNVTGAKDSIVDGDTGILVPFGDSNKLADAVEYLTADRLRRIAMARNARNFVSENFDRKMVWKKLSEFYGRAFAAR